MASNAVQLYDRTDLSKLDKMHLRFLERHEERARRDAQRDSIMALIQTLARNPLISLGAVWLGLDLLEKQGWMSDRNTDAVKLLMGSSTLLNALGQSQIPEVMVEMIRAAGGVAQSVAQKAPAAALAMV